MKHLFILNYRRQVLGVLSVDSENHLKLHMFSNDYQQEFKQLMEEITTNTPLPLRTYDRRIQPGNNQMVARLVHLQPSNPDFLWGVRAYLTKKTLGNMPIMGQIIDKPDTAIALSHQGGEQNE